MKSETTGKKKMGRPFRDAQHPRHNRLDLRVTDTELAAIKQEAQRRGITVTDLLLAPFRKEK